MKILINQFIQRNFYLILIELNDLPKVSLNQWYAGKHWTHRQKMKKIYQSLVKSQCARVFPKDDKYVVSYYFTFKSNPLDASNCIAMVKMIEDIIFEDDKWDIVKIGAIESIKGKADKVEVRIDHQ